MKELIDGWADLLLSDKLFDALDRGEGAVINLLADTLDEWAQTAFPVYKTAVDVCAAVSQHSQEKVDCDGERIRVRNLIIREALELSGLIHVIRGFIAAWNAIPAEVRALAGPALEAAQTYGDLLKDPSIGKLYAAGLATVEMAYDYVYGALDAIWTGVEEAKVIAEWAADMASEGAEAIEQLAKRGLKLVVEAAEDIVDVIAEAADTSADVVRAITTTPGKAVVAVGTGIVSAGTDIVEGAVDVAGDVVEGIGDIFGL